MTDGVDGTAGDDEPADDADVTAGDDQPTDGADGRAGDGGARGRSQEAAPVDELEFTDQLAIYDLHRLPVTW